MRVADAKGGRRELGSDARVHPGVVAFVRLQRAGPQQHRQELVVSDDLDLGADHGAHPLVDLVSGQLGVQARQQAGAQVVLADEQGVHRRQGHLLVGAHVTAQEEGRIGAHGVGQALRVERQQAAAAHRQLAGAVVRSQRRGAHRIGTVDLRGVEEGGDLVQLLAGISSSGSRRGS